MKIPGTNNISTIASPMQAHQLRSSRSQAGQGERAARRFDTVSIGQEGRGTFELELKSRITREVRANATPGRLSSLSQQIQDGTYEPDAMSIARRMLLMTEEA